MTTTVNATDLGATVCRALMRNMDDKPIRLALYDPSRVIGRDYERTSTQVIKDQWTVTLMPTLDFVTVSANGKYHGLGLYDEIDIGGVNHIGPQYDYVEYPADQAQITGKEYVAKLRAVVERALAKVEEVAP